MLSAHLDHLGVGEPVNGDGIYNGAMDNAAGVATLLDIAQMLRETTAKTRRSLLFVAVTGEEKVGHAGSGYFTAHPTVPSASMVANLNVDMFLPLYPLRLVTVYGLNESAWAIRYAAWPNRLTWKCKTTRHRSATSSSGAISTTSSATVFPPSLPRSATRRDQEKRGSNGRGSRTGIMHLRTI